MTHLLATDFGIVPIEGYVTNSEIEALTRCACAHAMAAWQRGEECEPLSVADAKTMPEWSALRRITSMGWAV